MPRKRDIKHEFFKAEEVARVSPLARLLFIGLWTIADRDGRLEDRPGRIKIEVLPYDVADVDALLGELSSERFIVRYAVGGQPLIWIRTFSKHQAPHPKEVASQLPEYMDLTESNGKAAAEQRQSRGSQVASNPFPSFPSCSSTPPLLSSSTPRVASSRDASARPPTVADSSDGSLDEPKAQRKRRACALPDDFQLTAEREAYAVGMEVADPAGTFAHFRDHHQARGTVLSDWDAGWRTWCRNDKRFRRDAPGKGRVSRDDQADAALRGWYEREEAKNGR